MKRIGKQPIGMVVIKWLLFLGILALIVKMLWPEPQPEPGTQGHIPSYGKAGDFVLKDQHGEVVTQSKFAGGVWIASFIFTRCAGQCPLITQSMAEVNKKLADVPSIKFASFSVDPAYDTPEVLTDYAKAHDAVDPRWTFLTGAKDEMYRVISENFHLGVEAQGNVLEPIQHSSKLVLLDPAGEIRGYYEGLDAPQLEILAADARKLAAGK